MIQTRRAQRTLGDGFDCRGSQGSAQSVDRARNHQVLGDKEIVAAISEALAKRHPQSRTRGRPGTPAEVVLRLLVLKHIAQLEMSRSTGVREVEANLVYRDFTPVSGTKMPDAKTMGRWGVTDGAGGASEQIHPTDRPGPRQTIGWRKAGDGGRHHGGRDRSRSPTAACWRDEPVLTRTMKKKITGIAGAAGTQLRDRSRSVKWRALEIARAARAKGRQSGEKLAQAYRRLLEATGRVVGQAERFRHARSTVWRKIDGRLTPAELVVLEGLRRGTGKTWCRACGR